MADAKKFIFTKFGEPSMTPILPHTNRIISLFILFERNKSAPDNLCIFNGKTLRKECTISFLIINFFRTNFTCILYYCLSCNSSPQYFLLCYHQSHVQYFHLHCFKLPFLLATYSFCVFLLNIPLPVSLLFKYSPGNRSLESGN